VSDQNSDPSTTAVKPVFYAGIGASAGGLEALEAFFSRMTPKSGLAFIVIQHLSPDYKSLMVELLSKRTEMKVLRAEEGMVVEADKVYLIPPKKNLSIFHGKLLLSDPDHSKGLNLPIDVFLRSLADDQAEKAVGIILSGTGSDGVRGIRAIKEAGGMVMVQSEDSAKFDGMPRSAASTGLADFILAPEEMPENLVAFARHPYAAAADRPKALLSDEDGLTRIFALLRERTKVDFTYYKPSTILRRIERRMTVNQVQDLRDYVKLMESRGTEIMTLYRELLIGVTSFYRDREVFEELENIYLPELLSAKEGREVRFWTAGCSTGEEAYTLAIVTRECMEKMGRKFDVKIFATDLDRDAILHAGNGIYPESIAADLSPSILAKYFNLKEDRYRIDRSIREMVVFAQHNLIKDPPFTNIDLVSCRNLLIYLQPVLQRKAMDFFNFSLNPGGILLLGTSETTGEMAEYFESLHHKFKVYKSRGNRRGPIDTLEIQKPPERRYWQTRTPFSGIGKVLRPGDEERLLERFLQSLGGDYVPLAVVVNERMEVLHILGEPEGYLKLGSGTLHNDISKMASKDLSIPITTGLQKVFKSGEELRYSNIRLYHQDESKIIQLRIKLLPTKKSQDPLAAVFIEEVESRPREESSGEGQNYDVGRETEQRIHDLEQELQFNRENLQATIEELETSNEELQATNEELLASNEELQSTNEELQSVNEELHTVNAEYQSKIIELTELNNDLDNLMATTCIGTLFLDENLDIRKFTPEMRRVFKILETDVGRPLHHINHLLADIDPLDIVREVEKSGRERELEVQTRDGLWFLMRVLPYQVGAGAISGVVLTFTDISGLKKALTDLYSRDIRLASIYRAAPVGVGLVINRVIKEAGDRLCEMTGYSREELVDHSIRMLYPSEEDFDAVGRAMDGNGNGSEAGTVESRWKRKDGTVFPVLLSSAPLDPENISDGSTLTVLDLTGTQKAREDAKKSEERFRVLFETMTEGVVYQDAKGEILSANPAAERILGIGRDKMRGRYTTDPGWKTIREDGTHFPGEELPAMEALRTGRPTTDVVLGVYNPRIDGNRWILVNAVPLFENGSQRPSQVYATFRDITERKLAEVQTKLNEARIQSLYDIMRFPAKNSQDLLDYALAEAVKLTQSRIGYIYHYDEGTRLFTLNSWSGDVMKECSVADPQRTYELDKTGIWGEAVRQRKPILVNEFEVPNPLKKGYPPGHVHLSRFLTVPVFKEDKIIAVVGVANKKTPYDDTDIRQLTLLMDAVWSIEGRPRTEGG
jgi:two-component system CheB/CheR fusion protein